MGAVKRYLSKDQITEMGVLLLQEMVASGETIITSKEGAEKIRELDKDNTIKNAIQEMALKAEIINTKPNKSKSKYGTRFTPSPKRHRKAKTRY